MADTGWLDPTTYNAAFETFNQPWSNPGNITTDAQATRTTATSANIGDTTHRFQANGYGASISAGVAIDGVEFQFKHFVTSAEIWNWSDVNLSLADNTRGSADRATDLVDVTTTQTIDIAGGPSDLWGESLSQADVVDADFGVIFNLFTLSQDLTVEINTVEMKVYYTENPAITDVNGTESWNDGDTGLVITGTNLL